MAYSERTRAQYRAVLENIEKTGLLKVERPIRSPQAADIEVSLPGGSGVRTVINMCANNYLGLANHPEVLRAAHAGLDSHGYGTSSVRFICGTQGIHRELETRLSAFLGMQDTIMFPSCFDANGGVFEALLSEEDAVISDRLIHASLIDGIRLCSAAREIYAHSDMAELEARLKACRGRRRRMVVTDGVFSMDGDTAPLGRIAALCEEHDAMLFVDDSHATGFIGEGGRGTHEKCGVMGKVDLLTTTFGKALGGASGGCVSGRRELIDMCRQAARPYIHSNAVAPMVVAGVLKVLDLVQAEPERRERLRENTAYWRKGLAEAGFLAKPGDTPIVLVMLFDAKLSQAFSKDLYDLGIHAVGFFYPVVAKGEARIRTQISAGHERRHLDRALDAFVKVGRKYGVLGRTKEEIVARYGL